MAGVPKIVDSPSQKGAGLARHQTLRYVGGTEGRVMLPHLYTQLASWWPLLSPPDAYQEDAYVVHALIQQALGRPPQSLLELGCGSGTLASHLPQDCACVLNDLSPDMLKVAQLGAKTVPKRSPRQPKNPPRRRHVGRSRIYEKPKKTQGNSMFLGSRDLACRGS